MKTAHEGLDALNKGGRVARWAAHLRRRWMLWGVAGLGAAAIAAAVVVPIAIGNADHAAAVDQAHAAVDTLSSSAQDAKAASSILDEAVANADAEVAALNGILDALPPELVDPATARDDLAAAIAAVTDAAAQPHPVLDASAPDAPVIDDAASTEHLTDDVSQAQTRGYFLGLQTTSLSAASAKLTDAVDASRTARNALLLAAITKAPSIPIDRAGEPERAAVATALDALRGVTDAGSDTASTDVAPLVTSYTTALTAARASHDAAVAAEQEAQRQAQENAGGGDSSSTQNSTGSSSGGSWRNSSSGGSAGGGGGSNGGGGNTNGGSSSGGSSSGGAGTGNAGGAGGSSNGGGSSSGPARSPIKLVVGGSCVDFPNTGQSASYGSTLFMPADAAWHETYEIPGEGWGVRWSCF
ncbi:hypothetical protein [Microbacterium testaceum]|uniref:hypothetical protein n=1 Tax=Microbacterium testaceum TaxID=2033 RepID=UPI0007347D72|nr:hypothetical protein [Microbacterium testaceum]